MTDFLQKYTVLLICFCSLETESFQLLQYSEYSIEHEGTDKVMQEPATNNASKTASITPGFPSDNPSPRSSLQRKGYLETSLKQNLRKHPGVKSELLQHSLSNSTWHPGRNIKKTHINNLGINRFEVEIYVLLDSTLYSAIQNSGLELLEYLGIFFHSVNNIYNLSHTSDEDFPTIVFQVAQIDVLDSINEAKIFQPTSDDTDEVVIDIETVLQRLKKYAKKANGKHDKYDHITLLTGRDLYRKVDNTYQPDVLGVAYLNGACTTSKDEKYESFSVVEDVGGHFQGVYPAVHEYAHNMNAKHDSKKKYCPPKKGYIMSPSTERTSNMFQFSNCSLAALKQFLFSKQGKCLAKSSLKPVIPADSVSKFPGDIYSMLDMCEHFVGIYYNEVTEVIVNPSKSPSYLCKQLSCRFITSGHKVIFEPPYAPGENVKCDKKDKGRCVSGECIEK